ncbi:MAG: EamA family transporter RarD [Chloroflexi bacterium]|nr:EamA family transporter RarD [Ardenticatenaceae bacterium]MBL1130894.1 EamA family transporter RarD [Chloroflexota bacterium]NOG36992.1 EamA family transporter RarD [Chloroflexota bacterium]
MNKGYLYGIGAYLIWGFLPIYWKALHDIPAIESLSSRIVWSLVLILLLLAVRQHWRWLPPALKNRRVMLTFLLSGSILALNWGTYIWAVNANHVIGTSLGYFINPLVSVMLGVWFLQEKLRRGQWTAVAIATLGVLYLTLIHGSLPWIALTLAITFAIYGYIRKTAPLGALEGLTLETAWLFLPALAVLLYLQQQGQGHLAQGNWQLTLLLMGTGLITAVPLLWFSTATRLIPLSSIGLLQYIAPTCQFIIGVFLYDEPFTITQMVGFCCIWLALLIYTAESINYNRRLRLARAAESPIG